MDDGFKWACQIAGGSDLLAPSLARRSIRYPYEAPMTGRPGGPMLGHFQALRRCGVYLWRCDGDKDSERWEWANGSPRHVVEP
ncbi:uncharacterized protein ColSpa_07863 [Colletotrichum spaethianum]|uniref:Uncharacterized protein n=1 Tax=Colletotrichum spaethianum TaxID=700344 RepID=A0AA37P8N1_9PEZI|nr:uncharacterized protein ColSpa_07863 [Colletotrichum spaethianum]GKT47682.1 hypothetical protein ColSpa_07863 [Colletotrichum spaethianum]